MLGKEYWEELSEEDWENFAQQWLSEIRRDVGMAVVAMNFSAPPVLQWQFILKTVSYAESDTELGQIAAGPIEHLLGWHGENFIDLVEDQAAKDHKFARTLTGVWQYKIADQIWSRLQAITVEVKDPLRSDDQAATPE